MSESLGALIGLSNVVTRSRSRVPAGDDPDRDPTLFEQLRTRARRALEGRESFIQDAVILGRRVRLFSNSHHLADFWKDNLLSEAEWRTLDSRPVGRDPILTVHAMVRVPEEPEASYVSVSRNEVFLFNTSYYADLRACALEAVGRLVAGEGFRLLHAGAVEVDGRALLLVYPKEVIHPTPVWGLMELPGARFLADGWVAADAAGRLFAVEKQVYFRASAVESFPALGPRLLSAKFENVPDAAQAAGREAAVQAIYDAAVAADGQQILRGMPRERALEILGRLASSADARAIADPARLFGKSRVIPGPVPAAAVFLLQAGGGPEFREARAEGFKVPAWEVRPASVAGHPRELARMIARR